MDLANEGPGVDPPASPTAGEGAGEGEGESGAELGPQTALDSSGCEDTEGEGEGEGEGELPVGARVGRFEIRRPLGGGGMGMVYLGYDRRLDRQAAVKLLRTSRASTRARARLLREAQALARVSHQNVVEVYEADEHGEDIYIAMEFVDGPTLRQWLGQARRGLVEICEHFIAAGEGLAAAHARGLIHRDVKPDNLMLGSDGRTRVLDFGLAARAESDVEELAEHPGVTEPGAGSLALTRPGVRMGTPAYMAPEQHEGGRVDPRTDQFGFCVSLWEALYGERPFAGDTLRELASKVCAGELKTPPPERELPAGLHALLERGLAPDPEDRWPSMHELLAALRQNLAPAPAPAPVRAAGGARDLNRIVLAALFGVFNGAVGMHLADLVGIVLAVLSTIAVFYAGELLVSERES